MSALARRKLGRQGLCSTVLGLGGAPLGDLFECLPESQAEDVVVAALDSNITFFDTAPWYGHGLSEQRIGRVLRQFDRDHVVVSTKVGRLYSRPGDPDRFSTDPWAGGLKFEARFNYTADGFRRSYEDSLLRLGLNRVDCLVIHDLEHRMHSADALQGHRADLEASGWAALKEMRERREIRAIGAGINDVAMMEYFIDRFELDFFLVANPYTLLDQTALDAFDICASRGIQIVKGSPFASGILATGPIPGAVYDYAPASPTILEKTRQINAICASFGVALQAAALQFPLAHPAVMSVIPGATSRGIVNANVSNLATPIPPALWQELKAKGLISPGAPVPMQE